ncbi:MULTISPECIES: hypothetical protein [unclassified Knoellia]|uniref:hypothetical protein n=1 Tax=Knoellia altitudinis TaxID=3404795 RepID=UPI00360E0227
MENLVLSDDLIPEARRTRDTFAVALTSAGVPGELVLTGGLSVPGALTKGDVDLHLRVEPHDFGDVVARLELAYPVASPHSWAATLAVFDVPGTRATGLAVTPRGSEHDLRFSRTWWRLRHEPVLLEQYNALKVAATGAADYEEAKSRFFSSISGA